MTVRYYSSVASETTLVGGISPVNTTMQVQSVSGLPLTYPYTMAVDYEGATEELVTVTNAAGTTLTITRAYDGTSAAAHNVGARVRHVSSAQDFRDSRNHENANSDVHGIGATASVVGTDTTQTLSNKTLNMATGTLNRIDIFNTGSGGLGWQTTINGDAGFPSTNMLVVRPTNIANEVGVINSEGAYIMRNKAATDAIPGIYRLRATKSDGTTDIFHLLAGGSFKTFPDDNQSGVTVQPRSVTTDSRAFSVRDVADTLDRFAVWKNGRVDILASDTTQSIFDLTAPASHASSYVRVMTSASANVFDVASTNKTTASGTMDIRNINSTVGVSEPVLRIFARNPGQTGDLTQWVDSSNVIQGRILANGNASFSAIVNDDSGIAYRPMQTGEETFVFSASSSVDVAVTFPIAFPTPPKVTHAISTTSTLPAGSSALTTRAFSITTTGFTLRMSDVGAVNRTLTLTAEWHAAV